MHGDHHKTWIFRSPLALDVPSVLPIRTRFLRGNYRDQGEPTRHPNHTNQINQRTLPAVVRTGILITSGAVGRLA